MASEDGGFRKVMVSKFSTSVAGNMRALRPNRLVYVSYHAFMFREIDSLSKSLTDCSVSWCFDGTKVVSDIDARAL